MFLFANTLEQNTLSDVCSFYLKYLGMNKIISKEYFSDRVVKFVVEAPLVAKARRAGHFVMVRVGKKGERIPLTIADADVERGTITLVVQRMGVSSTKLFALEEGDSLTD